MHRRLLLKVFAIADVVIYLTKAARLYSDMFSILADASDAFAHHFRPDLKALAQRYELPWSAGQLGPGVIVFQETLHTHPLEGFQAGLSGGINQSSADATAFPIFIQAPDSNPPQESQRLNSGELHYLELRVVTSMMTSMANDFFVTRSLVTSDICMFVYRKSYNRNSPYCIGTVIPYDVWPLLFHLSQV